MKVKEIDRTANVAWSPATQHPIYLAAGTAAQQLDATFSTTASLEIYALNFTEPGLDMEVKGSVSSDFRFHKLVWGPEGMTSGDSPNGILCGGSDGGNLFIYDPAKLISGETPLICQRDKHTGPVCALDFNPFQPNLLASGASESEIFIWDLNNPNNPMTPGAKSQPGEDVTCVAWNRQVQHILASTFPARCVVWDLRKNEPIIKVSDSTSRIRCKAVAWHPEVATQMCLASEDDHAPVIQLWDLRFATSPLKTLENHQRGVLSIAWCPQDPDLLLSCGKDSRILCWNPNSTVQGGEIVCELPTYNQWCFDVSWCPRNPAVIASSSFDGHVSVYSMMGGQQQVQPSSKIAESFPVADAFSQVPVPQVDHRCVSVTLKKPPKWLRKPVGACFGFGGKLVTFENVKSTQQQPTVQRICYVSQVTTETELISRSSQLESVLEMGQFGDFCQVKLANCTGKPEEKLWNFVKANFDANPRLSYLSLLGYDPTEVSSKINAVLSVYPHSRNEKDEPGVDAEDLALRMTALGSSNNSLRASPANLSVTRTPDSALNFAGDGVSAFDAIASTQSPDVSPGSPVFSIPTNDDIDGLISKAVLTGNIEVAVDLCVKDKRMADAMILAMAGGKDLLAKTQKKYFRAAKGELTKLISAVVSEDWQQVIRSCDVECWKEALAACLTYSKPQEFPTLCETLGSRLETEKDGSFLPEAMLCYICAGSVEKLVQCWVRTRDNPDDPKSLQDLVELVMVLRRAVEVHGQPLEISSGILATKLSQYAGLLAAQGSLNTALAYLGSSNEYSMTVLRDRLYHAVGQPMPGIPQPQAPFGKVDVKPTFAAPVMQQVKPMLQGYPTTAAVPQVPPTSYAYSYPQAQAVAPLPSLSQPSPASIPPPPVASAASLVTPQQAPPSASIFAKGHLASRYPAMPQDPSLYSGYSQPANYSQSTGFPPAQSPAFSQSQSSFGYSNMVTAQQSSFTLPAPPDFQSPYTGASSGYSAPVSSVFNPPPSISAPPINSNASFPQDVNHSWNDPPPIKQVGKADQMAWAQSGTIMSAHHAGVKLYDRADRAIRAQAKQDYEPPPPITQPIFNADAPEPVGFPSYPAGGYAPPQQGMMGNYMMPQQPQQQLPQQQMSQFPQQVPQQEVEQPSVAPVPEPPKPKGPIPAEHQVLCDVFGDLKNRCIAAANNPQMKRKLEDVSRKLESLYDKLREQGLSQSTILGLHQIVQAIQQMNYQTALQIHSQIIASGTFSEISSFMPGLKVLLQMALQLNVYIM